MVVDVGFDVGLGSRRRLVDLSALAAVSGEHVERQHHLAFGLIHGMLEYTIMIWFGDANWDSPPGTGYLTVAVITISAILTAIMTLLVPHMGAEGKSRSDRESRSLTLAWRSIRY
jgi:hypothetical protein